MNNLIDYLRQLELSDMQARLYLKLLETGPISVSDLAKELSIKRTSTYLYLEPLYIKGLVTKIVNKSKKQVAPTDPENLEMLIDQKITFTKSLKKQFPSVLQDIKKAFPGFEGIANVEITSYKGIQNARRIYKEALNANEVRAFAKVFKKEEQLFPDNIAFFNNAFKENQKLKMWEIIYDSDSIIEPSKQIAAHTDRYLYIYMPKDLKLSSEDILIYDGKVAIINYKGNSTSIILESSDFYNNLKALFDFVWNILSPSKIDL